MLTFFGITVCYCISEQIHLERFHNFHQTTLLIFYILVQVKNLINVKVVELSISIMALPAPQAETIVLQI